MINDSTNTANLAPTMYCDMLYTQVLDVVADEEVSAVLPVLPPLHGLHLQPLHAENISARSENRNGGASSQEDLPGRKY